MGRKQKPLQPVKPVEYEYVDPKKIEPAIKILAAMLRAVAEEIGAEGKAVPQDTPKKPLNPCVLEDLAAIQRYNTASP